MATNSEIGRIIKHQRVVNDLTLHELAARAGVSTSHIARIERGERFPSARVLRKLAKPLGFDEADLFSRAGYLSPVEGEGRPGGRPLDPYVAMVLSEEPMDVQRAVVAILSLLKTMAKGSDCDISFAEYAHRKYPELDDDVLTMIEDILEHPPKGKVESE